MVVSSEFELCRWAFPAMGDGIRPHIILVLLKNYGGMGVGEITQHTNLSRSAVSHHLKILKDAGTVGMFQVGTKNFYHVHTNESQWAQITALVNHINTLVQEVSLKRQAGEWCCNSESE